MDNEIFKSKFAIITYNEETEFLTIAYLSETEDMIDDEFKELIMKLNEVSELYKPKFILSDNRKRLYAYEPDIQFWTVKKLVPTWTKYGLKKYAQVLSDDIIGKLSSIQILELANKEFPYFLENKIFEDFDSAIEWLKL